MVIGYIRGGVQDKREKAVQGFQEWLSGSQNPQFRGCRKAEFGYMYRGGPGRQR